MSAPRGRAWEWGLGTAILLLAVLLGIGFVTGSYGFALVAGAPFVAGFVVGRWVKAERVLKFTIVVVAVGSIIFAAVITNLAGAICGFVIGMILAGPLLAGVVLGSFFFNKSGAPVSLACVAIVAVLIPLEPRVAPEPGVESVTSTYALGMSSTEAFSRITFYEDTTGQPPRLLRIALPRPIRTTGGRDRVGAVKRCIYDQGYIVKQITAFDPGVRYTFRVLRQVGVESHSVALTTGSFDFTELGPNRTRLELTTSYVPKLTARLAWRPFEQAVVHAMHDHIVESMNDGKVRRSFVR